MAYPFPLKFDGITAKREDDYGVDPTPAINVNGVRAVGRLWPALGDEYAFPNEREDVAVGSFVEAIPGISRGHTINLDIQVELKGSGIAYAADVLPEADPLIVACCLAPVLDPTGEAETYTYSLADTGHLSCTIWAYAGGKVWKINGCRGNMIWDMVAGELGRLRFTMQGMVASITELGQPAITYDATESPAVISMGLDLQGFSPNFATASLDLGNEIVRLDDGNGADGLEGFFLGDRKPRFNVGIRNVALSDYDPPAIRAARTIGTIAATLGSVQYNKCGIAVTDSRILPPPAPIDDNSITGWDLGYMLRDLAILFD